MTLAYFEGFYDTNHIADKNLTNGFWVIVGADLGSGYTSLTNLAVGSAKSEIQVKNAAGKVVDSAAIETYSNAGATNYGVAVNVQLSKKLLVPPGGQVVFPQASPTVYFQGISGTLEEVLPFI